MWPSIRGQTVPHVRHLLATFLDSFVLVFDFITSLVLVCNANTKAYGPNRCGGGAVGCGGNVVDSDAPEFPISVHVAEVPAEPSEDLGSCLYLRGCSCTPCVC